MAVHAQKGPFIGFGQGVPSGGGLGQASDPNTSRSPSLWDQGCGIMDPRVPYAYNPGASMGGTAIGDRGAYGWWGQGRIEICNQVPSTLTLNAIAAAQVPVTTVALTLVSTTGAGITAGVSITRADTGVLVTGLLAIDGAQVPVQNGTTGGNIFWAPATGLARAVSIQSAGDDHLAVFTVRGFDVYNFPMTETITGGNTATVTGKKAFKYIRSITPVGTLSGSNVNVGQSDVIGFMLRVDLFQFLQIWWPDQTLIASGTGFTAADTATATATTGDVRGTYALQGSASNNTRRLVMFNHVRLTNTGTAAGMAGVTQFADF